MKANICDVCKTVYTTSVWSTVGNNDIIKIESTKLGKIDLCNDCHDRLVRWVWKGEKLTRLGV